ncbi:MAG: hypothetical protein E7313_07645 [Clostridiales bacterium]|nr:hypothetical protein [Clostridiales bacterium]
MEDKSKNTGLIIALVIFIIISLVLGGFIVYDKIINNDTESTKITEKESNEQTTTTDNEQTTKKDAYQVLELAPVGGIAVVYNGEVYVNVYDSTPNIDNIYGKGKFQTLTNTRNNYKEYNFGELIVTTKYINAGGSGKWLKLNTSNVKLIYNNEYGQALSSVNPKYGIVMINSDSTVSYISTKDLIEGNVNTTKLDTTDISNVVTEDNGGYITYLVKSDGTKINVDTLIK